MDRLKKLIGMIFILRIVFFIICDEKGYKIGFENNHIVFNKTEKKSDFIIVDKVQESKKPAVYKNSSLIYINYEFKNPKNLRKGIDNKSTEKVTLYKNSNRIKIYSGFETPATLRKSLNKESTISSAFQGRENEEYTIDDNEYETESAILYKNSNRIKIYSGFENPITMRKSVGISQELLVDPEINNQNLQDINTGELDYISGNDIGTGKGTEINENTVVKIEKYEHTAHDVNMKNGTKIEGDEGEQEKVSVKIEKYKLNKHPLNLKKGVVIEHSFIVEDIQNTDTGISDSVLNELLENEEIDINTLESENDEFLQKVFEKTRDTSVMNLIVENYLNEYQFIKAKNFIENLPEIYRNELKPLLNLRVSFNSFPLTSKTISESLTSLVQDYASKNVISSDDKNRYMGVIALIDRNYDKFFEISAGFTSEKYKAFASKLQGYKDQISKQMGMPDYYFDTLVSLELFNQGLFQPAKILALSTLQKNPNYILPYQILAYANFLTNSRDTSIEYMKKLEDLDPNNAEKYRFLMGVAFYRNEKYEQSVVMLSMIRNENLRLDTQRYLINDYLKLDQKNKLISSWNKLLGYENLVASDFYTYFYETFFHPYSEGKDFQLYAFDTELANKMLRICSTILQNEEKAVCTYGTIGRNIALGQFDGMEQYLLDLVTEYPQGYLYQALGDYYIQQGALDKAKAYLLKAVSLSQNKSERSQIKKLLEDTM